MALTSSVQELGTAKTLSNLAASIRGDKLTTYKGIDASSVLKVPEIKD
jgi:hypothetical protein